jgi:hypothetical protein
MEKEIEVTVVNVIGWGGGPTCFSGIDYKGSFSVEESIGGMLKFTALEEGSRRWGERHSILPIGFVFYSAPNTIRNMGMD